MTYEDAWVDLKKWLEDGLEHHEKRSKIEVIPEEYQEEHKEFHKAYEKVLKLMSFYDKQIKVGE